MLKLYAAVVFVISSLIIQQASAQSIRQYRTLNKAVSLLRTSLLREIDTLKFEILDLKYELDNEKMRTARLESLLNDTGFVEGKQSHDANSGDIIKELKSYVEDEKKTVLKLAEELNTIKEVAAQVRPMADAINDTREVTRRHERRINDIKQHITDVNTNLKLSTESANDIKDKYAAFNTQFYVEIDNVTAIFKKFAKIITHSFFDEKAELRAFQKNISSVIESMSDGDPDSTKMAIIRIEQRLNDSEIKTQALREELLRNRRQLRILNSTRCLKDCAGSVSKHTTVTVPITSSSPTGTPNKPTAVGLAVTLKPGGPRIYPMYGEELVRRITIGSRVVRGKDWAWNDQDGYGPGTVTEWYKGDRNSRQVMVDWDHGSVQRANYRIGAYGKYDLYLLAE